MGEAVQVLQRAGKLNGKDISRLTLVAYEREADPSVSVLFSQGFRQRTVFMSMIWFLGLFGYYGASLASSFIFDGGDYINYVEILFASSGEVAGVLFAMLAGRQWGHMQMLGASYSIAAVASVGIVMTSLLFPPKAFVTVLAFFLRLGAMAGSAAVWVATPPAYPTFVRSTAHSFLFAAGRVGGLVATLWPSSTPVAVVMGAYAVANGINAVLGACEGKLLEEKGMFASLASDLNATDLERRSRSVASRSARVSIGTTGRPSLSARVLWV